MLHTTNIPDYSVFYKYYDNAHIYYSLDCYYYVVAGRERRCSAGAGDILCGVAASADLGPDSAGAVVPV